MQITLNGRCAAKIAAAVLGLSSITATAAPARSAPKADPMQTFDCEYSNLVKGEPRRTRVSFDPTKPFSFMEAFAAGHWVQTVTVTPEQVIDIMTLYDNRRDPGRASRVDFTVFNRRTLAFRRHIERIDPATYEPIVESDRGGVCVRSTSL